MINNISTVQNPRYFVCLWLLALLLALIYLGIWHGTGPSPVPANASPLTFSSERALNHLQTISQQAHPIGTPANSAVRGYIVGQLQQLGLDPQIQTELGIYKTTKGGVVGMIQNIVVRIPGKQPGKALMLSAHYDSMPTGPGAADDGASVAAILETVRAIRMTDPLQHDLICIFTDGEEAGLLGSGAFVVSHPLAKSVGLVLNFEYRGNSGPMMMFETSNGNGKLIPGFAKFAMHPIGNSLLYEIYKFLPNDTDMSQFKLGGIKGMNFAAIETPASYHAEIDQPERLDQTSLQHEGELMLSLVRHFCNTSLEDLNSLDYVYFDVPGAMMYYPVSFVTAISLAVTALFGIVFWIGVRRRQIRLLQVLFIGIPTFIVILGALALGSQMLWKAILLVHPEYQLFIASYNSHWYLLAFVSLLTGIFSLIQVKLNRWLSSVELAFASMFCWILLLVASSIWMAGASFLFTWPLLPVLLMQAYLITRSEKRISIELKAFLLLVASAPAIVMFAPFVRSLYIGLGPKMVSVVSVVLVLLIGMLSPLLTTFTRRWLFPMLPLSLGIGFLAVGSFTAGYDKYHPRPNELFYAKESVVGDAYWLSSNPELDNWTRTFFPEGSTRQFMPQLFGNRPTTFWVSRAPQFSVAMPVIELLDDRNDTFRSVLLRVRSLRHAERISVMVEGAVVLSSTIQGHVFSDVPCTEWSVSAYAMPSDTIEVGLKVKLGQSFRVRVIDRTFGLSSLGVGSRPVGFMGYPFGPSDTVQAISVLELK